MSQFTFILSAMLFGKFEFSTYLSWKQIFACRRRCVGGFFFSAYDSVGRGLRLRPPLNQLNQMDETNQVVHTAFPAQLIEKLLRPSSCNAVEVISYDTNAKIPPKNLKKEKKNQIKITWVYIYIYDFLTQLSPKSNFLFISVKQTKMWREKIGGPWSLSGPRKGGGEQNEKKGKWREKRKRKKKSRWRMVTFFL